MDLGRWFPASLPPTQTWSHDGPWTGEWSEGSTGEVRHDISHMQLDDISETKSEIEPFRKSRPGITGSKSNFQFLEKNILQLIPCTKFLGMFSCITSGYFLTQRWTGLKHRRRKPHERKDSPQERCLHLARDLAGRQVWLLREKILLGCGGPQLYPS